MRISPRKDSSKRFCNVPFTLISKLRDDEDLTYLSIQPKTGKKGRQAKYGGKVDVKNLDREHFNQVENSRDYNITEKQD